MSTFAMKIFRTKTLCGDDKEGECKNKTLNISVQTETHEEK